MFKVLLSRCLLGLAVLGAIALIVFAFTLVLAFIQNFDIHLFLYALLALVVCYIIGYALEWWWGRGAASL